MQSRNLVQPTPTKFFQVTDIQQNRNNLQPRIIKIEGYCANTGQTAFLQWHDKVGIPTNGDTPMWEVELFPQNGYTFDYAESPLCFPNAPYTQLANGLVVATSTTQGTYTAPDTDAHGSTYNMDIQEWEYVMPNGTKVGDTTTAVASLQVWADGTTQGSGAAHRLNRIIFQNNAPLYAYFLQLFTTVPTAGQKPVEEWPYPVGGNIPNMPTYNGYSILDFGEDGYLFQTQVTTVSPPVLHNGCYLYVSTTAGAYTAVTAGGGGLTPFNIEAFYQ